MDDFNLVSSLVELLPVSPFLRFVSEFEDLPFLGWLNWFFPVSECITVLAAWLGAIILYYLYSIVARWLKVIT